MFWLGGEKRIVPEEELKPEMYEDRIFLPGVIHGGEDYLVRVYLNDVANEGDPDQFVIEYLTKSLILKAYREDPDKEWPFNETLTCEAENYCCYNDGSGDFASLVEAWPQSVIMSNSDLVDWARGVYKPGKRPVVTRDDLPEFLGQIIDIFEDFLEEKGIDIPNDEREDDNSAIIYGTDYGILQSELEQTLIVWGVVKEER